jgi:hypothetical protein
MAINDRCHMDESSCLAPKIGKIAARLSRNHNGARRRPRFAVLLLVHHRARGNAGYALRSRPLTYVFPTHPRTIAMKPYLTSRSAYVPDSIQRVSASWFTKETSPTISTPGRNFQRPSILSERQRFREGTPSATNFYSSDKWMTGGCPRRSGRTCKRH